MSTDKEQVEAIIHTDTLEGLLKFVRVNFLVPGKNIDKAAAEFAQLTADSAAKDATIFKMVSFLQDCANDRFCDNDGRGCGSGLHAQDLLDELIALSVSRETLKADE